MDRISHEKLNVEKAKLHFRQSMDELSFRRVVHKHPLATTGILFAVGFFISRSSSISSSLSLLSLANAIARKL